MMDGGSTRVLFHDCVEVLKRDLVTIRCCSLKHLCDFFRRHLFAEIASHSAKTVHCDSLRIVRCEQVKDASGTLLRDGVTEITRYGVYKLIKVYWDWIGILFLWKLINDGVNGRVGIFKLHCFRCCLHDSRIHLSVFIGSEKLENLLELRTLLICQLRLLDYNWYLLGCLSYFR